MERGNAFRFYAILKGDPVDRPGRVFSMHRIDDYYTVGHLYLRKRIEKGGPDLKEYNILWKFFSLEGVDDMNPHTLIAEEKITYAENESYHLRALTRNSR